MKGRGMVGKNFDDMITATGADPGALDALLGGAKKNRAAMSKKQKYDAKRIRVRFDVPESIKELLVDEASGLGTSVNDLGTFLLVYALALYLGSQEMDELLEAGKEFSRSPRKEIEIHLDGVLAQLQKAVASAAERAASVKGVALNGAYNGADDVPHWLDA